MLNSQILTELQNAVAEKGDAWVLAYLKGRDGDMLVQRLIAATCTEFGLSKTDLLHAAHGADARRVLAEIMAENGYKAHDIGRALNKSRQAVGRYLQFMAHIKTARYNAIFQEILNRKKNVERKF